MEPTYSGMLGGYMELNEPDLQFTKDFLQRLGKKFPLKYELAIDCASGVGRNTI